MLDVLEWNTLKGRRDMLRAVMMHKIIRNIVDIQSHAYLTPTQLSTKGHHHRFQQLPTYVDSYKFSFFPEAIKIWNNLPEDIVEAPTLQLFKEGLYIT